MKIVLVHQRSKQTKLLLTEGNGHPSGTKIET